jgi:hypothetical protein
MGAPWASTRTVPTFSGFVRKQIGVFDLACGSNSSDRDARTSLIRLKIASYLFCEYVGFIS